MSETYALLSAPFDQTFTDVRGGAQITYVTGEQVISRLNDVLGVSEWSFRVIKHDIQDADEVWALGELVAEIDGKTVTRQQFGSQKIRRSKATGMPLDIGFDLKGATTDSLKKCASLIGIALYLSHKESVQQAQSRPQQFPRPQQRPTAPPPGPRPLESVPSTPSVITCRAPGGCVRIVSPALANEGMKMFRKPLCQTHFDEADAIAARQEQAG